MIFCCRDAARLECLALDRPLTGFEKFRLRLHHLICRCPVCCAHKDQLDCFEKTIVEYKNAMECCERKHKNKLCPEARERICEKLRQEIESESA